MAHLAKFAGCLYLAPVDESGALQGPWEELGEAAPLSIQLQDEEPTTRKGRTCKTYGQVIASKANPGTASGTLTMFEYTALNVSRALKGMIETTSVAASTLSEQEVTLKEIGQFVEIGKEDLSGISVTTSSGTTLVEGTDYEINAELGLIAARNSTVASSTVKISGESAAYRESRIVIGAATSSKYAIKGLLINEYTGKQVKVDLYKVLISTSSEIVLLSEEETEAESISLSLTPEAVSKNGVSTYGKIDGLSLRVASA